MISGGLNHGIHDGWFGDNISAAARTGRLRHLWAPDATSLTVSGGGVYIVGGQVEGGILAILRGDEKGVYGTLGAAGQIGGVAASVDLEFTKYYYDGAVGYITKNTFTGSYMQLNIGVDVGVSAGFQSIESFYRGQPVFGYGRSIGFGFSPHIIDISFQKGGIWDIND